MIRRNEGLSAGDVLSLLLNISLPMVLIFALVHRGRARRQEGTIRTLEAAQREYAITEEGKVARELAEAILREQIQRLTAALLEVEQERRAALRLHLDPSRARFAGGRLDDAEFALMCRAVHAAHADPRGGPRLAARVRARVLEAAGLLDGPVSETQAEPWTETLAGAHVARNGFLSPQSRAFLDEGVTKLLTRERDAAVRLQHGLMLAALRAGLAAADPDDSPDAGGGLDVKWNEIVAQVRREIDCPILPQTLQELSRLPH